MDTGVRVSLAKEKALLEKMRLFNIRKQDIEERFIHSQGPGGQNVNKTSTCVYLKHIPTGTEVKCQKERSQVLNRYLARVILVNKIEQRILKKAADERRAREKLKRQKRKRSGASKRRMLEHKRKHAAKKGLRARVTIDEFI